MPSRLAQHLVMRGLLPTEKANEALRRHAVAGGLLDTVLLEQGLVDEVSLLASISEVSGVQKVNLADFEPNPDVASFIPPGIAERLCIVPLSLDGQLLHVACGYPVPKTELDEVGFLLGKQLVLWVSLEVRVRDWISTIYKSPLAVRFQALLAQLDPTRPMPAGEVAPQLTAAPQAAPEEDSDGSLTAQMVERLAQSVAREPIAIDARKPEPAQARPAQPPAGGMARTRTPPEFQAPVASAPNRAAPPNAVQPAAQPPRQPAPAQPPQAQARPAQPQPPQAQAQQARPAQPQQPQAPQARPAQPQPPPQAQAPQARPAQPQPPPQAQAPQARPAQPQQPAPQQPAPQQQARPAQPPPQARPAQPPPAQPQPQARPPQAPPPAGARPQQAAPAPQQPAPAKPLAQPPPAPAAAPEAASADAVPEWTLAHAREELKKATPDREELIGVALQFARRAFDFVAAFAVIRGAAVGWDLRGEGDRARLQQVSIPLDSNSVFRTVAMSRGSYMGPLPPDGLTRHFVEQLGRAPRALFVFPVEVKGRLVAMVYGDSGGRPVSQLRLSEVLLFCQDLPAAFQELIYLRKKRGAATASATALKDTEASLAVFEDVDLSDAAPAAATQAQKPVPGLGWSPFASGATTGVGRAVGVPAMAMSEGERPPPDFGPLLQKLTGPDAAQRARAVAELARTPEHSARALAGAFPGPSAWSRLPVEELPEADELGPIPGALARLGRPAALALAPLLESQDSDTRYLALLTAGNLPYAEVVDGVLRGLFDREPDISSAARAAATAFKRVPRFQMSIRDLRGELASPDAPRRALAARALGILHDREAVDGLIGLIGSPDQQCAQAAAEALREITRATFGADTRRWAAWWAENRGRRRIEWLVASLRHAERDVRQATIEELARATNATLGFEADATPEEREAAVRQWETLLQQPRWQRFDVA